jgi:hypothetical protein
MITCIYTPNHAWRKWTELSFTTIEKYEPYQWKMRNLDQARSKLRKFGVVHCQASRHQ